MQKKSSPNDLQKSILYLASHLSDDDELMDLYGLCVDIVSFRRKELAFNRNPLKFGKVTIRNAYTPPLFDDGEVDNFQFTISDQDSDVHDIDSSKLVRTSQKFKKSGFFSINTIIETFSDVEFFVELVKLLLDTAD